MMAHRLAAPVAVCALLLTGCADDGSVTTDDGSTAAAAGPSVRFTGAANGDVVASPFVLGFEATDFEIVAAGSAGDDAAAGHMHVMIDADCVPAGETIPDDESHVHLGDGATEVELTLEDGAHTLCLQAGDDDHSALDITDELQLTVEGGDGGGASAGG